MDRQIGEWRQGLLDEVQDNLISTVTRRTEELERSEEQLKDTVRRSIQAANRNERAIERCDGFCVCNGCNRRAVRRGHCAVAYDVFGLRDKKHTNKK